MQVAALFIGIYLVVLAVIGYFAGLKVKNSEDFLVAGRGFTLFPLTCTNLATMLGGGSIIGLAGAAYSGGFSNPFWYIVGLGIFGWWASGLLWARPFRNLGLRTVPEALNLWYGPEVRTVCAIINVLATSLVTASQFLSGASIVNAITGISFDLSYYLTAAVIIMYTVAGGLVAVVWTDVFQTVVLVIGLVIAAFGVLGSTGGWHQLIRLPVVKPSDLRLMSIGPMAILGYIFSNFFNSPTDQVGIVRMYSARDASTARWAAIIGGAIYLGVIPLAGIVGLAARNAYPGIVPSTAFPRLVMGTFPPVIGAVIVVAALGVVMSTADSTLQAASSCLTVDIYKGLIRKEATDSDVLRVSRWLVVGVGVFAVLAGKYYPSILGLIVFAFGMRGAGFFLPIALRFLNVPITKAAAFWSSIIGCGTAIVWLLAGKPWGIDPVVPGFVLAAVCMAVIQLVTAPRQARS